MDPKVYGKLLTTHRRGLGGDGEALHGLFPSGGASAKAPRWDLADTEGCGSGNSFLWCSWMVSGYVDIYRRRKSFRGATRQGARPPILGAPATLVAASATSWRPLQVSWIAFVPKRSPLKVSFRLDSIDIPFLRYTEIGKKNSNSCWASG